ncbi:hypothetical protein [Ornithinimicrobium sp. CNJ-824]|uniref:hypothetical protein n=1 Tax=Ornithinimicrobium sp. CNJ-824 TaxID=1904966 RepID=UPI00118086D2|nr:hypothetical protein [Ornithinimicrobium sp. CNJ-824]
MSTQHTGGLKPTRRTLVKGAAWSVPVVAIGASAAVADVQCSPNSCPPPPAFDFDNAYKNPGGSCESSCVPKQSYGVPVTLSNASSEDYYIQFTSYLIGTTSVGVHSITSDVLSCAAPGGCAVEACGDNAMMNAVCVPAGTASMRIYVTSGGYGSSPQTGQSIGWQWVRKSDCEVTDSGVAASAVSPPGLEC